MPLAELPRQPTFEKDGLQLVDINFSSDITRLDLRRFLQQFLQSIGYPACEHLKIRSSGSVERSTGGGTHYKPETRFHRDAAFGEIMGSCEGFHFGTHLQDMPKDIFLEFVNIWLPRDTCIQAYPIAFAMDFDHDRGDVTFAGNTFNITKQPTYAVYQPYMTNKQAWVFASIWCVG